MTMAALIKSTVSSALQSSPQPIKPSPPTLQPLSYLCNRAKITPRFINPEYSNCNAVQPSESLPSTIEPNPKIQLHAMNAS